VRALLEKLIAESPELFPSRIVAGYQIAGKLPKVFPIEKARLLKPSSPNWQLAKFFVHHSNIFLTSTFKFS